MGGWLDRTCLSLTALKSLLVLLAIATVLIGVSACGSTGSDSSPQVSSTAANTVSTAAASGQSSATGDYGKADADGDGDFGSPDIDRRSGVLSFGRPAGEPERQAIVGLVRRFYTAALADEGAKACPLLYSLLAESAPEDYGLAAGGPEYLRGAQTCEAILSKLFNHFHARLAAEVPQLGVKRILLRGNQGVAVLGFGNLPERELTLIREGHVWKVDALLDGELP